MKKKDRPTNVLLPIIKRVVAKTIAEDLVGVQPMPDTIPVWVQRSLMMRAIEQIIKERAEKINNQPKPGHKI